MEEISWGLFGSQRAGRSLQLIFGCVTASDCSDISRIPRSIYLLESSVCILVAHG